MISDFPILLMGFRIPEYLCRDAQIGCAHFVGGPVMVITAPIDMKPDDIIMLDPRSKKLEIVERGGIVIWRAACVN